MGCERVYCGKTRWSVTGGFGLEDGDEKDCEKSGAEVVGLNTNFMTCARYKFKVVGR